MNAGPIWTVPVRTERNCPTSARPSSEANRLTAASRSASVASDRARRPRMRAGGIVRRPGGSRRRVRVPDGTSSTACAPNMRQRSACRRAGSTRTGRMDGAGAARRMACRHEPTLLRVAPEVADGARRGDAGGGAGEHADRPRAAARAQPRGRAGARGRGARRGRRAGHDRRRRRASRGSGSTTPRWRRWRSAAASSRRACATSRRSWPAGGSAATTVASTAHLAALRRHPRVRHRRARRRPPRGARELGRVGRPDHAGRAPASRSCARA